MCILYIYIICIIYIMYIYCYIHTILFGDTLLFWCYRAPVPSLAPQSLTWPSICEPQTLKQSKPLTLSLKLVNTNPETLCNLLKPYKQNCRCYKKNARKLIYDSPPTSEAEMLRGIQGGPGRWGLRRSHIAATAWCILGFRVLGCRV